MSIVVAPLPSGLGVTAVNEHRTRRDPNDHRPPDEEATPEERQPDGEADTPRQQQPRPDAAPPIADEPPVPAETLFAAALFAVDLVPRAPSPEEMKLRHTQDWQPPESTLRLKDRLI